MSAVSAATPPGPRLERSRSLTSAAESAAADGGPTPSGQRPGLRVERALVPVSAARLRRRLTPPSPRLERAIGPMSAAAKPAAANASGPADCRVAGAGPESESAADAPGPAARS